MNDELDNLTTVKTNSQRGDVENFDISHDVENRQFEVSEAFYAKEDMNNNGFTAHYNPRNECVYLSIRSNEDSVSYKGRSGFDKGNKFTSSTMSELFEKLDLTGPLMLEEAGVKDDIRYYRVEAFTEEDSEEMPELVAENSVDQEDEIEMEKEVV